MKRNREIYTSYARTAIYLSLVTIDVRGKEVLLPTFTCVTNLPDAIIMAGGKPVYVDINTDNLELNLKDLESKLSNKTQAIISHHYYGNYNKSVGEIDKICKKRRIIHIEDLAHGYGLNTEIVGDMGIYSFSKNMVNPGGGLLMIKNSALYDIAVRFQQENKNMLHSMVMNFETQRYKKDLLTSRYHIVDDKNKIKHFLIKLIIKFSTLFFYNRGLFYGDSKRLKKGQLYYFDTRMTKKQLKHIKISLSKIDEEIIDRKNKAKKLDAILKPFFTSKKNVYTNYPVLISENKEIEKQLQKFNIKFRRTWPTHQSYSCNQLTRNVKYIRDNLILIDLETLEDDKILKLKTFFDV